MIVVQIRQISLILPHLDTFEISVVTELLLFHINGKLFRPTCSEKLCFINYCSKQLSWRGITNSRILRI